MLLEMGGVIGRNLGMLTDLAVACTASFWVTEMSDHDILSVSFSVCRVTPFRQPRSLKKSGGIGVCF